MARFVTTAWMVATMLWSAGARAHPSAAETDLEGRLIAPCCWVQTLDQHESEHATSLRAEIHRRLAAGEDAARIEDDLAARFGDRIRAVPKGQDPYRFVPVAVGFSMLLAAVFAVRALRNWTRHRPPETKSHSAPVDEYDALLDEELRRD